MEFMSRNGSGQADTPVPAPAQHKPAKRKHFDWNGRAVRIEWFIFTLLVAIVLIITIAWAIFNGNLSYSEDSQVNTSKYQAVFLNGGSTSGSVDYTTYFGHITKLTDKYVVLKDIYYLTTSQTSSSSQAATPQLTKLGCQQLHSPYDEMIINRNQVAFWENLQDSGKVVTAIKDYIKTNPNGPDCSAASSSSSSSTSSNSQSTQSTTSAQNSSTTKTNTP